MCATSWRTSHAVQSVDRVQSSGWSASTASATRWYSVWASRIAVGRSIAGWTTLEPGQAVVVMIMRCSSWRWSDDAGPGIELPAGFASVSLRKADAVGPEIDRPAAG
jgi:hypothetical protein